jgi:tRNA (guanosine-2'-O-)-methyltransferase
MTPERHSKMLEVLQKRQTNITVVLENVQDPHNISAVMRTCDAVGIQDIYILNTKIPRHKKWGFRSSGSAKQWLTVHEYADVEKCIATLRKNYDKIFATHLSKEAISVYDINFTEKIALIFGNEHSGVSEEVLKHADGNFIIPQMGIIKSLNISVACAVTLYEGLRQKNAAGDYNKPSLSKERMDGLVYYWSYGLNEEQSK